MPLAVVGGIVSRLTIRGMPPPIHRVQAGEKHYDGESIKCMIEGRIRWDWTTLREL